MEKQILQKTTAIAKNLVKKDSDLLIGLGVTLAIGIIVFLAFRRPAAELLRRF